MVLSHQFLFTRFLSPEIGEQLYEKSRNRFVFDEINNNSPNQTMDGFGKYLREEKKHSSLNLCLLQAMGMEDAGLTCGAVCVYPNRVAECVEALKRSNPKRRVRNWKHRFDPGTRRKTSQWLQWRLAFQVAKCLLPPGFRWLKLLQLDFVHHLFLSALFFGWNCIDMQEIKMAVADGAKEIDIVINRCFYYCVDRWTKDWELK